MPSKDLVTLLYGLIAQHSVKNSICKWWCRSFHLRSEQIQLHFWNSSVFLKPEGLTAVDHFLPDRLYSIHPKPVTPLKTLQLLRIP